MGWRRAVHMRARLNNGRRITARTLAATLSSCAGLAIAALACDVSGPKRPQLLQLETAVQRGQGEWDAERMRMVDQQLSARGIHDARVLDAMRTVPRHRFVPDQQRHEA